MEFTLSQVHHHRMILAAVSALRKQMSTSYGIIQDQQSAPAVNNGSP
jgi:hypothetical protein